MQAGQINRIVHSRGAVAFMFLAAVATTWFAIASGNVPEIVGNRGIAVESANEWLPNGIVSFAVNMAANAAVAILSVWLSKSYNPMRSISALFASMFLLLQIALPWDIAYFYEGTLLLLIVIVSTLLMFSVYQNPTNPRRVFLVFFIIALASLSQYAFLLYLPLMLIGMAQMKIFNLRNIVAGLIGSITPLWILMGTGFIRPSDFEFPEMVNIFISYDQTELWLTGVTVTMTIGIGILFLAMNFIKMLSYNARIRAANGYITTLMIATMIFSVVDFNNVTFYMPTLNWLVAYQIAHFFATSAAKRSYLGVLFVAVLYFGIYFWNFSI